MDTINNHPTEDLLVAYSAGSLPLSQALCISAHLEHCPRCQQKMQNLNHVGSELFQNMRPATVSESVKSRLFEQLDDLEPEPPVTSTHSASSDVPRCLHQFFDGDYDSLKWKRVSADIYTVELCRDSNGARVELLKIRPGGSAHTHTHLGDEYTVILEGSFSDETGVYREGDFVMKTEKDRHTPVATLDRECICLAVTEGPVQFTGFFTRMLNPLIRYSYA